MSLHVAVLAGKTMVCSIWTYYLLSTGVVSTLARNVKTCVLRLCPDRVCFVIMERGPAGGSNIWCELTQV